MADIGALSTLGLGSNGALSYSIIDKLKAVDKKAIISPIDKNIAQVQAKEKTFQGIMSELNGLKTSLYDLSGPSLYTQRTINVTGSDISATVTDGATVQEIDAQVKQLAKANIQESKGFDSADSSVTDSDTDMTITIGGVDTTFTVTAGTTVSQLKDQINSEMDGKVNVSMLDIGSSDTPYHLVLKSAQTGSDQNMSFSYSGSNDFLSISSLQDAQDAVVNIDGVDVTRSKNVISDAISGVTLTLNNESTSTDHISVKQDEKGISDTIQAFVDKYNETIGKLKSTMNYDPDTKKAGVFQGDSTISSLKRQLSTIVEEIAPNNKALSEFGIEVDRYGKMSFDSSKFTSSLETDPQSIQDTFAGTTSSPGVFAHLKNYLDSSTIYGGLLSKYDDFLKGNLKQYQDQESAALERINDKYDVMAKRFMAYDSIIAKMNASFNSLSVMLNSANSSSK